MKDRLSKTLFPLAIVSAISPALGQTPVTPSEIQSRAQQLVADYARTRPENVTIGFDASARLFSARAMVKHLTGGFESTSLTCQDGTVVLVLSSQSGPLTERGDAIGHVARMVEPPLMITHDIGAWNAVNGSTTKLPPRPLVR